MGRFKYIFGVIAGYLLVMVSLSIPTSINAKNWGGLTMLILAGIALLILIISSRSKPPVKKSINQ